MTHHAATYPTEFEAVITLPIGRAVAIRPLRQYEERPIREMDRYLTVRSRYLRFFSPMPVIPDALIRQLASVDYQRSLALIAECEEGGMRHVLGLASFTAVADETAELGLLVRDDWQRQRIGTELATRIVLAAETRGWRRFVAYITPDNIAIRRLLHNLADVVATSIRGNALEVLFVGGHVNTHGAQR